MAQRVEILSITVPITATRVVPQETDLVFRQGFLERLTLRIPPGPSGLLGIRVLHSGRVVIPYERDDWLITDDEIVSWSLEEYPTGAAWTVNAFNEGLYEHTFQIRLEFQELGRAQLAVVQRLDVIPAAISGGVLLEGAGG